MVLLLAVLAVTVAFYLGMMISYLVQSREEDHALVRTRGFGLTALFRIYSFEGILLTAVAIVVSPVLAIALVAAAGVTPHFRGLTDGGLLPIVPQPAPFIVAWIVGLLCLAAVVLPSVLTAQGGVLAQKFRAARPPAASLLHRYHLDVVFLVLGGLIFWELQARGAVVSGRTLRRRGHKRDAPAGSRALPDRGRALVHASVSAVRELRRGRVAGPAERCSNGVARRPSSPRRLSTE